MDAGNNANFDSGGYTTSSPYLTDVGHFATSATLGGFNSYGYGTNNGGDVTGESTTPPDFGSFRAFLSDGSMENLGTLGGDYSVGYGFNDSGQITGVSYDGAFNIRSFLYDGTVHDLGINGTSAASLNNAGQITGYYFPSGAQQALLYDKTIHALGALGSGAYSEGRDINDSGQIVGSSYTTTSLWRREGSSQLRQFMLLSVAGAV